MMGVLRFGHAHVNVQSEWVICRVFTRKQQHLMISDDDRKLETEEGVVHGHPLSPPDHHVLAMEADDDGCFDSEQEAAPPVVVTEIQHTAGSHLIGAQQEGAIMEGDDQQHCQMVLHEDAELLMMHHQHGSSSSFVVSPCCWLNQHDDQLVGAHFSASLLPIMQMQSHDADYYLPELLEYGGGVLDAGGEEGRRRRAEITTYGSVGSSHLDDGLYWNIGF